MPLFDLRPIRRLDWTLLLAVLGLSLFGLLMIYSATRSSVAELPPPSQFVQKQALWLLVSLLAFALTMAVDYERWSAVQAPVYLVSLLSLAAVLAIGRAPTGAVSWFAVGGFHLQPSEFAKIAVILSLSAYLAHRMATISERGTVLTSLLIPALPVGLVLVQPDFGTALVIIAIWFGTLFLAGARLTHLTAVLVTGLALFLLLWNLGGIAERWLPAPLARMAKKVALKDYQKRRLTVFLNPQADPLGAGYHVIQSRIAVGSGRFVGRGLFRGTQSRLRFIPERHTDFIFSVIGEELGFLGCLVVLAAYFFVCWRGLRIARRARDTLGTLIAAGAGSMLAFHTIVNVGMSVNIMPITGIPLPFISYGGSNLLTSFVALGLLQNVHMRRDRMLL